MIQNTDLSITEGLAVYEAAKGGVVSRENLRAADGSLREV